MKTVAEVAKELQVTPQAVYKRLNQFNNRFKTHIHKGLKGETLDAEGCLKRCLNLLKQQVQQPMINCLNSLLEQQQKTNSCRRRDEQIRCLYK